MSSDESSGPAPSTRDAVVGEIEEEVLLCRLRRELLGAKAEAHVGRYRIVEMLGAGGMGVVYGGIDDELDRRVAVKVLGPRVAPREATQQRLLREAKAMARLSHPNVAHVYEVGREAGQFFLAMELIDGTTLRNWCVGKTHRQILDAYIQAGEGLAAAHAAGIVHRDFKPDNALIGIDGRVRVLDFGLASSGTEDSQPRPLPSPHDATAPSAHTGAVLGTPAYMAPEQHWGGAATALSDQFSFCVALFEALYAERPFRGRDMFELAVSTRDGDLVPAPKGASVPRPIHRALLRGLRANPSERYPSMTTLLAKLTRPKRRLRWLWPAAFVVAGAAIVAATAGRESGPDGVEAPTGEAKPDPWAAIVAASAPPTPVSLPGPDDPTSTTIHRLRNGLTLYLAHRPGQPLVSVATVVRAAARDEGKGEAGVSSLLSVVLQHGTERLGTLDFSAEAEHLSRQNDRLASLGPDSPPVVRNAVLTQLEASRSKMPDVNVPYEVAYAIRDLGGGAFRNWSGTTNYYSAEIPASRFDAWALLLAETLRRPVFRFVAESTARALHMLRASSENAAAELTALHEIARSTGTGYDAMARAENLQRLPYAEMRDFYQRHYKPNNVAVIVVGDITAEEVLPALDVAFGDWEPAPVPRRGSNQTPLVAEIRRDVVDAGPAAVHLAWPVANAGPSRRQLQHLVRTLRGHKGLLRAAADEAGLAGVEVSWWGRALHVGADVPPDVTHEETEAKLREALQTIGSGHLPDAVWERAEAEAKLSALRWARSPSDLVRTIATTYAGGDEWTAMVPHLSGLGVDRERLRAATVNLVHKPAVVIYEKTGPSWTLAADPLPITQPPLRSDRRSEFTQRIVEAPARELEPKFLVPGVDYVVAPYGRGSVVTHDTDDALVYLRWVYPVGATADPWACDAVRAKVRASDFAGTELKAECSTLDTRISVVVSSDRFAELRSRLVAWLRDPKLDSSDAQGHIERTLAARRIARQDPRMRVEATRAWALFGKAGLDANLPSDAELQRRGVSELPRALREVVAYDPHILVTGPRASELRSALPATTGRRGRPRPSFKLRDVERPTIYVLQDPGRRTAEVLAAPILEAFGDNELAAWAYSAAGEANALPQGVVGYNVRAPELRPDIPLVHAIGISAPPGSIGVAIGAAFGQFTRARERHEFDRELADFWQIFRARRVRASHIPVHVHAWGDREGDPRIERWLQRASLTPEAAQTYAERVAQAPLVAAVVADLSETQLDELSEHGAVEMIEIDAILRDPESSQLGLAGLVL